MGFPTPFPEPESPDLRRYLVSTRPQILGVLRALCDEAPQVNAFVDGGPEFDVATLREVDDARGQIHCQMQSDQSVSRLTANVATFVGFVTTEKVQFFARAVATGPGKRSLSLPLPEAVLRMARRRTERSAIDSRSRPAFRLRLPDGSTRSLSVSDIGVGGLAFESAVELAPLIGAGRQVGRGRLDLPGVGGTEVSLTIRHCTPLAGPETLVRIGCEFLDPAPRLLTMIERYLCSGAAAADGFIEQAMGGNCTGRAPDSFGHGG